MKHLLFISISSLMICYSCTLQKEVALAGSVFESNNKDAFGSSKLFLEKDSTFIFYGQGPSTLLSTGRWNFDKINNKLSFKSDTLPSRFIQRLIIDTFWIDISSKKGRLVHKDQITIDDVFYYKK